MNEISDKILPYEARAEYCLIFHSFFGQWSFKKKCFLDLLTFTMYMSRQICKIDASLTPPNLSIGKYRTLDNF